RQRAADTRGQGQSVPGRLDSLSPYADRSHGDRQETGPRRPAIPRPEPSVNPETKNNTKRISTEYMRRILVISPCPPPAEANGSACRRGGNADPCRHGMQ